MAKQAAEPQLSDGERKAIFLALVEAQDSGMNAVESRKSIAKRFSLSDRSVRQIEEDGLEGEWPPL